MSPPEADATQPTETSVDATASAEVWRGRRVVLGVTGGIAAYKAIDVCRRLVDAGAHVVPVLTQGALRFVGATTFSALASEPAQTSLWSEADPIPHTRLGQSADVVVVCPATARLLAAYRMGLADDLLTATLLATRTPVVVCPAMHTEMWEHPSVQDNLAVLGQRGVHVVAPATGRLAGGDVGAGRLADPDTIVAAVGRALAGTGLAGTGRGGTRSRSKDLAGLHVLVTAGGTREAIDPVRFIGNRSSGKQGHALANAAAERGAAVTLVTTVDQPSPPGAHVVPVTTAAEMHDAVLRASDRADVVVMAAAVADFRPVTVAAHKLKKTDGLPDIVLEPTADILAALGRRKRPGQTLVGFAAETRDVAASAAEKLARKQVDLVVANDVSAPHVGFEHDTNQVMIVSPDGIDHDGALSDKRSVADAVLDAVLAHRHRTLPKENP